MKDALKSFGLVTLGVLICAALAWIYMRASSETKTLNEPMKHPFLTKSDPQKPYLIAFRGGMDGGPENTTAVFDKAAALGSNVILWVDLRPTKDGRVVAYHDQDLASSTDGKGWVNFTNYSDIAKLKVRATDPRYKDVEAKIPTLEELLDRYPKNRFILNIMDFQAGIEEAIVRIVDERKAGDRILIQSPQDGVLKGLREKKPTWLFGTSQARATQLRMLSSIGLATMAPLKGDVYVTELRIEKNEMLNDAMIAEIKRRNMPLIVGPVESAERARELVAKGADGIITSHPSELDK